MVRAYAEIYTFPFPARVIPGTGWIGAFYDQLWTAAVPWVGRHFLQLEQDITVLPNGSGDTTFNYVQTLCHVVLAVLAAIVWSIADRRRGDYARLLGWLRVYLRYVLAVSMWGYGMNKVIKLQFPFPSTDRLMEPYGDSSPMGLLWTFMGFSTPYTFFAGACEVLAARDESGTKWTFHFTQPDASQLTLGGLFAKAALNMRLRKIDESKFTLVGRGFHWINEYPFNK